MIHFFTMLNTIRLPDKNELRMKLLKIKHKTFISSAELPSGFEKCGKKWAGLSWAGPSGPFTKCVTNKQMKYQKKSEDSIPLLVARHLTTKTKNSITPQLVF